jgi:hypothetical protein
MVADTVAADTFSAAWITAVTGLAVLFFCTTLHKIAITSNISFSFVELQCKMNRKKTQA